MSPALSFVDIYSDGEQFRDPKTDTSAIILDHITRPFMRIGFTGRQLGAQPMFLPSALGGRVHITDWLLARVLPFGNVLWAHASWYDETRLLPVLRVRQWFGDWVRRGSSGSPRPILHRPGWTWLPSTCWSAGTSVPMGTCC